MVARSQMFARYLVSYLSVIGNGYNSACTNVNAYTLAAVSFVCIYISLICRVAKCFQQIQTVIVMATISPGFSGTVPDFGPRSRCTENR